MESWLNLYGFWPQLLLGLVVTLQLSLAAIAFAIPLGVLGALAKRSPSKWPGYLAKGYTGLIRGIPELLIILLFYFGSTQFLMGVASWFGYEEYIEIPPFWAGLMALALVHGAYMTEVFRAALDAIPKGQWEAGQSLGLTPFGVFRWVIFPQLWRLTLPPMGNLYLVMLKDTSLISIIGVADLMRAAYVGAGSTHQPFTFYAVAALMYLTVTFFLTLLIHVLEQKVKLKGRG